MRNPKPWHDVWFDIAFDIAQKSKDDSTQVGAVLVAQDNRQLSLGYNGPPPQIDDNEVPWNTRPEKYAYILHADENALLTALDAWGGKPLIGSKMYLTAMPCTECVLRMIRCGVKEVLVPSCRKPYVLSKYQVPVQDIIDRQFFPKLDIQVIQYEREEL